MILKDIIPKTKHSLNPDGILKIVALNFGLKVTDLKSDKRTRKMTVPRQISMYLMRKHLLLSYPEIGKHLGGKDHTTILHGVSKIAEETGLNREALYRTLSKKGNPQLLSPLPILQAAGLRLSVQAA